MTPADYLLPVVSKPEPNMLKILIPSNTSQNVYPLFLFYSYHLPIIPLLVFCINALGMY